MNEQQTKSKACASAMTSKGPPATINIAPMKRSEKEAEEKFNSSFQSASQYQHEFGPRRSSLSASQANVSRRTSYSSIGSFRTATSTENKYAHNGCVQEFINDDKRWKQFKSSLQGSGTLTNCATKELLRDLLLKEQAGTDSAEDSLVNSEDLQENQQGMKRALSRIFSLGALENESAGNALSDELVCIPGTNNPRRPSFNSSLNFETLVGNFFGKTNSTNPKSVLPDEHPSLQGSSVSTFYSSNQQRSSETFGRKRSSWVNGRRRSSLLNNYFDDLIEGSDEDKSDSESSACHSLSCEEEGEEKYLQTNTQEQTHNDYLLAKKMQAVELKDHITSRIKEEELHDSLSCLELQELNNENTKNTETEPRQNSFKPLSFSEDEDSLNSSLTSFGVPTEVLLELQSSISSLDFPQSVLRDSLGNTDFNNSLVTSIQERKASQKAKSMAPRAA